MKITSYFRDKITFLIAQLILIILFGIVLNMLNASIHLIILLCGICLFIDIVALLFDYFKRRCYYEHLYRTLENMDKKQYIATMLELPDFLEGEIMDEILKQVTKAMNDEIACYQKKSEEYEEYIETWIHEVKLPISCIEILCENNKNEVTRCISDESKKIDGYVEQALYYARSTNLEKDYSIRTVILGDLVKDVVKKHSKQLIACDTQLEMKGLDYTVYTDPKWLNFILGQIISNSMKYKRDKLILVFDAIEESSNIILRITDNGIGIPSHDLKRVMNKGFTGENGRQFAKSTGIGLYLCNQLCDKMHLGFYIESQEQIGTTLKIIFPKDKLTILEK